MFTPPPPLVRLLCGVAIGVVLGLLVSSFALDHDGMCGGDNPCFREWVSALSGWAAALGAVLALVPLWQQLAEMRRQTAFTVGDAEPTIELEIANQTFNGGSIRIINWNRRRFYITELLLSGDKGDVEMNHFQLGGISCYFPSDFYHAAIVPGWEDRTQPPPVLEIHFTNSRDFRTAPEFKIGRAELSGYLVGNLHVPVKLRAEIVPPYHSR